MMKPDDELRQQIYETIVERGQPPRAAQLAKELEADEHQILDAFKRLASRHLLVLARESGEIVMAPPFSAVPTPFLVAASGKSYFANCVWDAFGISAALHQDARIDTSCGCCGEPMTVHIRDAGPLPGPGIGHFAVPAAHWWDDITFT